MRKSTILIAAATAVLLGLAGIAVAWWDVPGGRRAAPSATGPGIVAAAPAGGPFTMVDHAGRTVTDQTYRGKYLLVFFGYAHCPDVCPTTLDRITRAIEALGPDGEAMQPLFVSVDPKRDTPEVLAAYVGNFHPRIVGLTGSEEQVRAMAAAYRVYVAAHDEGTGDYSVDHSAFEYLTGLDGKNRYVFTPAAEPERVTEVIRGVVRGEGGA
jgi:protein SCO2